MINHDKLQEAIRLIREERERQILVEGFTPHLDKVRGHENLVLAAATYEMEPKHREEHPHSWPWDMTWWKPSDHTAKGRIKELKKAGALYMAAKQAMELNGINIPLKQAVCQKIDLMAEKIAELMAAAELEYEMGETVMLDGKKPAMIMGVDPICIRVNVDGWWEDVDPSRVTKIRREVAVG